MGPAIGNDDLCLFLDVDGTLLDIAARPEQVVVPPGLVDALQLLDKRLNHALALISGRTIADLDRLFHPLRLSAGGVHGAELRVDPAGSVVHASDDVLEADLIDRIRTVAARTAGTLVEDKRFSVAIHYRQIPEAGQRLEETLEGLIAGTADPHLRILPGHMVFEIKRATFDKGTAIRRFMAHAPFEGRMPVFLGDDVTDRPGFAAVVERGGQAFAVGRAIPGTTGLFPNPASVRSWLADLAAKASQA